MQTFKESNSIRIETPSKCLNLNIQLKIDLYLSFDVCFWLVFKVYAELKRKMNKIGRLYLLKFKNAIKIVQNKLKAIENI